MRQYFSVRRYVLNVLQSGLSRFAEKISAKKSKKLALAVVSIQTLSEAQQTRKSPLLTITYLICISFQLGHYMPHHLYCLQFCRPCSATVVHCGTERIKILLSICGLQPSYLPLSILGAAFKPIQNWMQSRQAAAAVACFTYDYAAYMHIAYMHPAFQLSKCQNFFIHI